MASARSADAKRFLGRELRPPTPVLGAELELDFVSSDLALVNELDRVPLVLNGDPEGEVVTLEFAFLDLRGSAGQSVDGARDLRIALQRHPDRHVLVVEFERPGPYARQIGRRRNRGNQKK